MGGTTSPGLHSSPAQEALSASTIIYLPDLTKDKKGQEHKNVDMVMVGSIQSGKYLADMIFVQLFTPSDLPAKFFTP